MAATTADLVAKFLELDNKRKKGEEDIEQLKELLKPIKEELLGRFERASIQQMKALGQTVYISSMLWTKNEGTPQDTVLALQDAGLHHLVEEKCNSSKLSAYVRELAQEHAVDGIPLSPEQVRELLPEPLRATVSVTNKIDLRAIAG